MALATMIATFHRGGAMRLPLLILTIAVFLISSPVLAHHGGGSLYDMTKETTVKATITDYVWTNPHVEISFDAAPKDGGKHWVLEAPPPNRMLNWGWTRKSLHPGDAVTVTFNASKRGSNAGYLIKVVLPSGQELRRE